MSKFVHGWYMICIICYKNQVQVFEDHAMSTFNGILLGMAIVLLVTVGKLPRKDPSPMEL